MAGGLSPDFTLGLPALDDFSNWVGSGISSAGDALGTAGGAVGGAAQAAGGYIADKFSPSTIMSNLGEGFGGDGNQAPDAVATDPTPVATGVAKAGLTTPPVDKTINPLAMQLYFAQNIAPLLSNIMDKSNAQSKDFLDMAQKGTANLHLPDSYRGIFESMLPRQQAAHADVMASLAGAAVAGPALDSLQKQIATATNQATKDYYAQQAAQAYGAATGGGAIPSAAEFATK